MKASVEPQASDSLSNPLHERHKAPVGDADLSVEPSVLCDESLLFEDALASLRDFAADLLTSMKHEMRERVEFAPAVASGPSTNLSNAFNTAMERDDYAPATKTSACGNMLELSSATAPREFAINDMVYEEGSNEPLRVIRVGFGLYDQQVRVIGLHEDARDFRSGHWAFKSQLTLHT